ncbi:MAG: dihydrolipoyl dehydrogenase [Hyphomicrobiales bacterium]
MAAPRHDLLVIGSGPGGYVAAIRAAQLGLNVGCVESVPELGGTCLRVGCIPSKALLESSERYHEAKDALGPHGIRVGSVTLDLPTMMKRKDEVVRGLTGGVAMLFKKHKITRYEGRGRFEGPGRVAIEGGAAPVTVEATNVLIATGSRSATLPGIAPDGDRIATSTEALAYPEVPRHLVVIGAGYIGLELGSVWLRLGAKVTVLEYLDRILPGTDSEIAAEALKLFKRQGMEFRLGQKVTGAKVAKGAATVTAEGSDPIEADRVLLAVGRVPDTEGLGLDAVGIETDARGRVPVDDAYRTSVAGIYAIGDVIGGAMLAHKASEEGVACVERIVTGYGHVNYDAIPGVVYTQPEIAGVGRTEDELKDAGVAYRKGVFFFRGIGRSRAMGQIDGRVKILADERTDRILGVHLIGPRAGDLIAEAVAAIEFGASSEDLARICHAHPTLAEAVKEAALAVDGRPIHA